jgi:asparagine synthase (glutamine-hydrolysing)
MAHSLEVRAPILDHKLMELAARIPSSLKLRGMNGKYILKKALGKILPQSVLRRRKMGFAVPISEWFRNDLKEFGYAILFSGDDSGLLNGLTIRHIWEEHQSGLRDRSTELWAVLMFRLWEGKFMKCASDEIRYPRG